MVSMNVLGIGVDVTDIKRFRDQKMRRNARFIVNTFTEIEREYCYAYKDYAPHLAGAYAAKEAVRKVYGDTPILFLEIEVRHHASGKPEIWIKGKRSRTFLISISHSATVAIAVAFNQLS
ncbi:TPA: hypothetical protein DIV48_01200 [Candidatus Kaiserbacteria bacterium]|nr:MAG: Holo-ACP synthase [Parcubacteria group bacterium GW2011_GWB1_57_6]HCR52248.1 hypothetical protein [Candidatus Kaiserbacteria bacterium]